MTAIALTETIARLFAGLPLLERIDLIVADARARGLRVDGIELGADDFETFRREAATHMLISLCGDCATYRGDFVRRRPTGGSRIEIVMPDGVRATLPIGPDVSMSAKSSGRPCVAAAAWTGRTGAG